MHYKKLTISLLFFLSVFTTFGQDNSVLNNYYNWFDDQVGIENTGLFNGLRYKEKYRTQDGNHKFYISSEYKKGNIEYDGQKYYDIEMKYDIYEDQIIVNLPTKEGNSIIQLIDEKIENYNIYNMEFVRVADKNNSTNNKSGFYETIYQSNKLASYKKYKKVISKHLNSGFVYYKFKERDEYYIYLNDTFYLIDSKKDVIKIFPEFKKEIKDHYKKNERMISSNYDMFIKELSEKISNNISNPTK